MRTRQGETIDWGYGFALPRLLSRPQEGSGEECGRVSELPKIFLNRQLVFFVDNERNHCRRNFVIIESDNVRRFFSLFENIHTFGTEFKRMHFAERQSKLLSASDVSYALIGNIKYSVVLGSQHFF